MRSSQRLGDDPVLEANPAGLAHARWRMRRGEGARVPEANGRNRRCRQRIVRRPPRPRKVESQSDDEVAEAKEIHSSALPVRVMLSVRPWPCQVPVKVAGVALSPPQPASAKVVIAAAGSAAIRDDEVMSHFHPPRHTRSGEFPLW